MHAPHRYGAARAALCGAVCAAAAHAAWAPPSPSCADCARARSSSLRRSAAKARLWRLPTSASRRASVRVRPTSTFGTPTSANGRSSTMCYIADAPPIRTECEPVAAGSAPYALAAMAKYWCNSLCRSRSPPRRRSGNCTQYSCMDGGDRTQLPPRVIVIPRIAHIVLVSLGPLDVHHDLLCVGGPRHCPAVARCQTLSERRGSPSCAPGPMASHFLTAARSKWRSGPPIARRTSPDTKKEGEAAGRDRPKRPHDHRQEMGGRPESWGRCPRYVRCLTAGRVAGPSRRHAPSGRPELAQGHVEDGRSPLEHC